MLAIGFHQSHDTLPNSAYREDEGGPVWVDWHVGERNPIEGALGDFSAMCDCFMVIADGHELEWIRANFTNLPQPRPNGTLRTVNFYGDLARLIAGNLSEKGNPLAAH